MAAIALFVAFPGHGLAAHSPFEVAVRVAALGKVGKLAGGNVNQCNVDVVPAAIADIIG